MNTKPPYKINPARVPGSIGYGRHKTAEPLDAIQVYNTAIWDERIDQSNLAKMTFWGLNKSGQLYRFAGLTHGDIGSHFNGFYDPNANSKDKEANLYIKLNDIPSMIKRKFNIKG